ncbi:uncharacterized protein LOC118736613 [Rhagoletis pomonella]|uniref:uncharacterized protein LOC118736613 n=1 Tax=Rhagoletis pomonella TaxID=28610 RepID=UPI00177CCB97|nr:uncharacterized protein LOC118736613 [Rhagoletis pomonella]
MVSQFPLDPMHLIDLGVARKMIQYIIEGKTVTKLSKAKRDEMFGRQLSLVGYIPPEIGVYLCDNRETDGDHIFSLSEIFCKFVCLPYQDKYVFIPILHQIK